MKESTVIHLTNVLGTGSKILSSDLLDELLNDSSIVIKYIHLPNVKFWRDFAKNYPNKQFVYKNIDKFRSLTRLSELLFTYNLPDDVSRLIVLGDVPLKAKKVKQIVLLQTPHITNKLKKISFKLKCKFTLLRFLFRKNSKYVSKLIVQTKLMKDEVESSMILPIKINIEVVLFPLPKNFNFTNSIKKIKSKKNKPDEKIDFFYPAALYEHKNHLFLNTISDKTLDNVINNIVLTIDSNSAIAQQIKKNVFKKIIFVGNLEYANIPARYEECDAVLFLSNDESFGIPLLEAAALKLPIIVPNLPYAKTILGDNYPYLYTANCAISFNLVINNLFSACHENYMSALQHDITSRKWTDVSKAFTL
jgi:glycosyltransferase involved in cell wall biosynthesis